MCTAGICGLCRCAISEMPEAQNRGSSAAPGICARNSGANSPCTVEKWIASSLAPRNDGECNLALRPKISAALVATVAVHADAGDLSGVLQLVPDEARKILQRRRAERFHPVEQLVVERLVHLGHAALQEAKIEHHAGHGIRRAADADFGAKRVAVNFLARRAKRRSRQRMRRLEAERFR